MRLVIGALTLVLAVAACDGTTGPVECGFGPQLLPYEVGYKWSYVVTEVDTTERKFKQQHLDRIAQHADYGEVIVQITQKQNGRVESYLRREGSQIRRFEQRDFDSLDTLIRTTIYRPYRVRIDESLQVGEQLVDTFDKVVIEPGFPEVTTVVTDVWTATSASTPCSTSMGTFDCVEFHRARTQGGVAVKDFFFAEGVGKIIERGDSQVEEIESCGSVE